MKKLLVVMLLSGVVYAKRLNESIRDSKRAYKEGLVKEEQRALTMLVFYTDKTIIACPPIHHSYKFAKKVKRLSDKMGLK